MCDLVLMNCEREKEQEEEDKFIIMIFFVDYFEIEKGFWLIRGYTEKIGGNVKNG